MRTSGQQPRQSYNSAAERKFHMKTCLLRSQRQSCDESQHSTFRSTPHFAALHMKANYEISDLYRVNDPSSRCGYQSIASARSVARPASPNARQRVTVLSYNIHHAEGVDGRLDLDRIAEVIRKSQADLVALQEVDQRVMRSEQIDQPQELAKRLGMHVAFGANIDLQGGKYGNAVLSRYPIKSSENHLLPNVGGGEQRGVLEVDVELPQGMELTFLATHFDHRSDPAQRLASAKFINELVDASKQPACLAGDLNAVPDSTAIETLLQQWTLPAGQDQPTIPVGKPQRKIDYILHSQASPNVDINLDTNVLEVESRVLDEAVASDHRPILSVLEFTQSSNNHPNVLFISIDDLNDWIGCLQGHPQTLTPNMDALASRGVLFTNAHCSSPACNPSRAAVFSGLNAQHNGVLSNDRRNC